MKLFHYTRRETALEHILPTGRLRFGRLPRSNDPREFAPIWFAIVGYVGEDESLTAESPFALIEKADELLRGSVHLLCLTEDQPSREPQLRYGTGPRRARMWAQYADNHRGVCLCFDGQRLIDAACNQLKPTPDRRSLKHGRVHYAQEGEYPDKLSLQQPEAERDPRAFIESMVDKEAQDLFFTKDWDWSSETEYRFLLRGDTADEEFIDIRGALEAVIAGQRFHRVYRPALYNLCQELGVPPFLLQWEMGPPAVVRMSDPGNRPLGTLPRVRGPGVTAYSPL